MSPSTARETYPVLFVMPHLAFGGAERLASDLARHLGLRGHSVTVAVIGSKPGLSDAGGAWFAPFARLVRVELSDAQLGSRLLALLAETGAGGLALIGLSAAYMVLPQVRRQRPDLRIVSFQFNEIELTREHARYRPLIDLIVVESANVAQRLIATGVPEDAIVAIPSGPDLNRLRLADREPGAEPIELRGLPRPRIAYIGRMDPIKGPSTFISVCELLRKAPVSFVMAGDGPIGGDIRAAAGKLRLGRRFRWLGQTEHARMGHLYGGLDVVVAPSTVDGRPLVVQEAQACGVAVVASRVGAIPDLIEDGVTGVLCEPGDVGAFARAVLHLIENPAIRNGIAAAGRRRALSENGLHSSLDSYVQAITGVGSDRGRDGA